MPDNTSNIRPTAYTGTKPYIFVSYAHRDSEHAFPFIDTLQKNGYNVWFDDGIRFGNEWEDEIAEKLIGCSVFLFLVSSQSLESLYCRNEIRLASEERKPFVNVIAEDVISFPGWYRLNYMRYQDCRLFNYDSYDEAVEALSRDVGEMAATRLSPNTPEGAFVRIGSYPQSRVGEKAPIEWLVLKNDGKKALLISKYALDCQQYNTSNTDVTWGTCSLRKWLNDTFVREVFKANEQNWIIRTTVTADRTPSYSTSPGNNTADKVFLLSIAEVKKHFSSIDARKCAPTEYAKAQGAWTNDGCLVGGKAACMWWLRSPGDSSRNAARVISDGSVSNSGRDVDYGRNAVRPALWINLES